MPANNRRCDLCDSWQPGKDSNGVIRGECRGGRPDKATVKGHAVWPITREDEWCGEFIPSSGELVKVDLSKIEAKLDEKKVVSVAVPSVKKDGK